MTGFPADWLALREPADRRARSAPVLAVTRLWASRRGTPGCACRVVDLGAGTGTNLRCLAPHLSAPPASTLVDENPGLLDLAQRAGRRGRIAASAATVLQGRAIGRDLAATHSLTEMVRGGQLITRVGAV